MKTLLFSILFLTGMTAVSQNSATKNSGTQTATRTNSTSAKTENAALPYDVNDKYMGRSAEFLNNLTVAQLPADFPVYDKKITPKAYNLLVDDYYRKHLDILKPAVKQKLTQK